MSKGGGGFFVAGAAGGAGSGSVTSDEASAISAQAASAINVVSNAVSVVSQAVSVLSQQNSVEHAALSVRVDTVSQQASVLSQAVSVISQQVSILSQTVSVHSQRFSTLGGGATSTYLRKAGPADFQWEWGSVTAGGVGSVTSTQRDVLSQGISVLSVQAALVDGTDTEQIWEKVFPGTNTSVVLLADGKAIEISANISVTSAELNTVSNAVSIVSTAASNALSVANAASNAASIVSTAASNALSVANAASNAASAVSQALSVHSQANSVTDAALSVRIDTQSQSISVLSQAVSVISQQVSVLSQTVSTHSQLFSTLRGGSAGAVLQKSTASDFNWTWTTLAAGAGSVTSTEYSVRSVGNVSTHGFQSVLDALSNRISAGTGGSASPTSNAFSIVSQKASAGIGLSAQLRIMGSAVTISATALTDISGLSVSVEAGGTYKLEGLILHHWSTISGWGMGLTFPAMTRAGGQFFGGNGKSPAWTGSQLSTFRAWGVFNQDDSGVIITSSGGFGAGTIVPMMIEGLFVVSTAGTIQIQARVSATTVTYVADPGSYIRCLRLS